VLFTYSHLGASKAAPRRDTKSPVFCIGRRAFVNWRQHGAKLPSPVPLTDGAGEPIANDLVDGQEVEILSWRPRARESVTYQVRRISDGSEWWISVVYLREALLG
jgi:hypothetical protein